MIGTQRRGWRTRGADGRSAAAGVLAPLVLTLVLAGCGGGELSPSEGSNAADGGSETGAAATDTPRLRELKAAAGIEECPRTSRRGAVEGGLPAITLECLGGGAAVNLAGLPAVPTVVNIWATWCGPCREEMPHFARLHEDAGDEVAVLGIDFRDPDPEGALKLAEQAGVRYPLVSDPEQLVARDLGVVGLPQTVFVDATGRIIATERVPITSYDQLRSLVREHLGVDVAQGGS